MVRLPEPTQDQNPLGDTSTIRESQPARDLARSGQAAQRRGWHEGHGKAGVSVATGPHSPEAHPPRSPSAAATAPAAAGPRWRPPQLSPLPPPLSPPRPIPPHLLTAPGPPPTPDSRRTSTSPGASRPPPGPAAAAPQEGGRRGMGGLRPVVVKAARGCHCGQQRFAPGDGGGGLNRAWAGGAGSRGPLAQC